MSHIEKESCSNLQLSVTLRCNISDLSESLEQCDLAIRTSPLLQGYEPLSFGGGPAAPVRRNDRRAVPTACGRNDSYLLIRSGSGAQSMLLPFGWQIIAWLRGDI